MTVHTLPTEQIIVESNVRFDIGNIDGLTNSIQRVGVLVPLLVVANGDNQYTLVAGHRRLLAAQSLGIDEVPVYQLEGDDLDDVARIEAQFAENVFRQGLSPVEKAQVVLDLQDAGLNQREIAAATGLPQRSIKGWQRLARADLSDVDGAGELNEQQLLELADEVDDESFINPVVIRFLNETVPHGNQSRFRDLESAYHAEERDRKKNAQWAEVQPLVDELTELGVSVEVGYMNAQGSTIVDAGSKEATHFSDNYGYIVLDLTAHRSESCHRAYVREGYDIELVETCAQPKRHVKEDATVVVADAPKIRKAQDKAAKVRKKERDQKAEQNVAYGDYLRDVTIAKGDQFRVAVDATERGFHYDWEKDIARWLELELPEPPEGALRNKWQFAIDEYTKGMSVTKRDSFITKIKVIRRHIEGSWRYSDNDRATELSVEAFGKVS